MSQWPLVKFIFGTNILPIIIPTGPFFLSIYMKSRDEFVGMPHRWLLSDTQTHVGWIFSLAFSEPSSSRC